MKCICLIFCFDLISIISFTQKLETNLNFSPVMTFESNMTTGSRIAFGFTNAIQEFYNVSGNLSIGTEINYSYNNYKLIRDWHGNAIPESSSYFESKLNIQTLNVPLILRYRTNTKWIILAGYGLSYVIDSKSKVDYVYYVWGKEETRTSINEKSNDLRRDFNSYLNIAIGKGFTLFSINANAQIFYELAFKDYDFHHGGGFTDILYIYKVRPNQIGIKIGIEL